MNVDLALLPDKPKCGSPCNGCGVCCASEVCPIGVLAYGDISAPCPALILSPCRSKAICGLVAIESDHEMEPLLKEQLGIGLGCSMDDGDDCVMPEHAWSENSITGFQECLFCNQKRVNRGESE